MRIIAQWLNFAVQTIIVGVSWILSLRNTKPTFKSNITDFNNTYYQIKINRSRVTKHLRPTKAKMYIKHTSVGTILLPHHPLHRYLIASWLAQFHPKPPPAICNIPLLNKITKLQSLGFQEDEKHQWLFWY